MDYLAKLYNKILLQRLRDALDKHLQHAQNGFRPGRSTISHIVSLREMLRYCRGNRRISMMWLFIDFTKAFDTVSWSFLRAVLLSYRVPVKLVNAIMSLYSGATARIRTTDGLTDFITLGQGVLQGDTLAPYLFIIVMDYIIRATLKQNPDCGFSFPHIYPDVATRNLRSSGSDLSGQSIFEVSASARAAASAPPRPIPTKYHPMFIFADDTNISASLCRASTFLVQSLLQKLLISFETGSTATGMGINPPKTEIMVCHDGRLTKPMGVCMHLASGASLEVVDDFPYLGALMASELKDCRARLSKGWSAVKKAVKIWKSSTLAPEAKLRFFDVLCQTIFLYGSESWAIDEEMATTLQGSYTRMLRFAKGLDFNDHPSIKTIYGNRKSVIAVIAERRLNFLGRVIRQRAMRPQPIHDILEQLVTRHRAKSVASIAISGYEYVDQIYQDLDAGLGKRFPRNSWKAITQLADNQTAWAAMTAKAVAAYPYPEPLLPPSRKRPIKNTVAPKSPRNASRHFGRTPPKRSGHPSRMSRGRVPFPHADMESADTRVQTITPKK
jgi:hypothetical protein